MKLHTPLFLLLLLSASSFTRPIAPAITPSSDRLFQTGTIFEYNLTYGSKTDSSSTEKRYYIIDTAIANDSFAQAKILYAMKNPDGSFKTITTFRASRSRGTVRMDMMHLGKIIENATEEEPLADILLAPYLDSTYENQWFPEQLKRSTKASIRVKSVTTYKDYPGGPIYSLATMDDVPVVFYITGIRDRKVESKGLVSTAAGKFGACLFHTRLDVTLCNEIRNKKGQISGPTTTEVIAAFDNYEWYVPGTGVVKRTIENLDDGSKATMELVSITKR